MRIALALATIALAAASAGCVDDVAPRDVTAPAAPRGVYSVTGDHEVTLHWQPNTEGDFAGYRIYEAGCASGSTCPYDRIGATSGTTFLVTGLANGVTRYFAVSALDRAGNESDLSYDTVFDTPRPAGIDASITNYLNGLSGAGWDFSAAAPRAANDPATDVVFGYDGFVYQMFARDSVTDIQDAGYGTTLDAVDWAPSTGWSPSGTVELVPGHCYVVWTRDDHYAKLRVTAIAPAAVVFDWAYQTAAGNPELHARPARRANNSPRPVAWLR